MEKKKLQLNEFAIEITRKCNMKCAHCLRGEAQKRNIHKKYITKVLCDYSYETQDELYLFDINETSFFEGIKSIIFNMD